MSYKTILVHVDQSRHAPQRMRIAADLALRHGAHLIGAAATGLSRFVAATGGINMQDPALTQHLNFLRRQAESALGGRFDPRTFHDALLDNGALPLDLLERQIRLWIGAQSPPAA